MQIWVLVFLALLVKLERTDGPFLSLPLIFRTLTLQPSVCTRPFLMFMGLTTCHLMVKGKNAPAAPFMSLSYQRSRPLGLGLWTSQLLCPAGSQRALCRRFREGNGIDLQVTYVNTKGTGSGAKSVLFCALKGEDGAKVLFIFTAN